MPSFFGKQLPYLENTFLFSKTPSFFEKHLPFLENSFLF